MYEKLKQLMREAGYEVSEGVHWLATDMQHFATFSRHVLGATTSYLNHMLAYPEAFPHVTAKADELAAGSTLASAPAAEPTNTPIVEPVEPQVPEAAQAQPEATQPQQETSSIFNVSASGQTDKQELNMGAEQPAQESASTGDATATQEQSAQEGSAAADQEIEQSAEGDEKPTGDQPNEGEKPQE